MSDETVKVKDTAAAPVTDNGEDIRKELSYLLPDKVYDIAKWVGLVVIPAIGVLVQTIGDGFNWSGTGTAVTVIAAVGVFIGAILGADEINARRA